MKRQLNNRKSIRLRNWDYSWQAYYFVTICTYKRECIFGDIIDGKMFLNRYGEILDNIILKLPIRFNITIEIYQIMPNHLHLIISVGAHHDAPNGNAKNESNRAIHESPLQKRSLLSQIVGYLKMNTSKQIHQINLFGNAGFMNT